MRSSVRKVDNASNDAPRRRKDSCTERTTPSGSQSHPPPRRGKSPPKPRRDSHQRPAERSGTSHSPASSPPRRQRSPLGKEAARGKPVRTYSPTAAIRLRLQAVALGPPEPSTPTSPTRQWRAAAARATPKDSGSKLRDRSPPAPDRRLGGMVKFRQHHRGQQRH